ncbi:regulatory protein RecX [Aminipila terrae]|uniref:Regulatory protein RecX n=1 Tax=Aminipila terrae TaxID=2697030 RepID=A0A6P1MI11_9FIRM|nr:regulatory protein RecX [Aminipila terrae]QHI71236.1 hypothetical protein Ami3637_01450 [Aminipila terrae]
MRADKNKEDLTVVKKNPVDSALKYLASRDRTCMEIQKYLTEKEFSSEEIQQAISYLLNLNYLNDEVYAEKYIEYAISKGKGIMKIKNDLRQKGIEQEIIDDKVSSSEDLAAKEERKRALNQALKIIENTKIEYLTDWDCDFQEKEQKYKEIQRIKGKIARRLQGLGYSPDVIFNIINDIFKNE